MNLLAQPVRIARMSPEEISTTVPTVVLLLRSPRCVSVAELAHIVAEEIDDEAAATVTWVGKNAFGGEYLEWRSSATPYHLGTFGGPYIHLAGAAKIGEPMRWHMREEVPPAEPALCEAWMAHDAWLYVDALNLGARRDNRDHQNVVLRIAGRLVDEHCTLLWLPGAEPKRVALPTPHAVAALRSGTWPG